MQKIKMQHRDIKILKNTHILVGNQNFEKQKFQNTGTAVPRYIASRKVVMVINGLTVFSYR
jgi:hypothetical protein